MIKRNLKCKIVIPTCNRMELLLHLLDLLSRQTFPIAEIIIVDSSDFSHEDYFQNKFKETITYKHTKIKSAAIQRNMGLQLLDENFDYLFFLDDDVEPTENYIELIVSRFSDKSIIGISGIALPKYNSIVRRRPSGWSGAFKVLFGLDSKTDGKLLPSCVNIPVREVSGPMVEVDWLIGCSAWNYEYIKYLKFTDSFFGQSLGEDVIFSARARRFGKLVVDPSIHLLHSESVIERPVGAEFWEMWVVNRWTMLSILGRGKVRQENFHLANIGQLLILIGKSLNPKNTKRFDWIGIIKGYFKLSKRVAN